MNEPVIIIDKKTNAASAVVDAREINLATQSIVELQVGRAQVKSFMREGDALIITFADGEKISVYGFFVEGAKGQNDLVLRGDDGMWQANLEQLDGSSTSAVVDSGPDTYQPIDSASPPVVSESSSSPAASAMADPAPDAYRPTDRAVPPPPTIDDSSSSLAANAAADPAADAYRPTDRAVPPPPPPTITDSSSSPAANAAADPAPETYRSTNSAELQAADESAPDPVASVTADPAPDPQHQPIDRGGAGASLADTPSFADESSSGSMLPLAYFGVAGLAAGAAISSSHGDKTAQPDTPQATMDTTAPTATATITSITDDAGESAAGFITTDTTPLINVTVTGTLGADEKVQISLDNGATWHDAAPNGDNYQYDTTGTPLAEGNYIFQARVVDAAGHAGVVSSQAVSIDAAPPLQEPINSPELTDDTAPDAAGNQDTASSTPTSDTAAPSVINVISSIMDDTGKSATDFITSDTTLLVNVTMAGRLSPDEKVQISLDNGVHWYFMTAVSEQQYQYDATSTPLPEGSYTFQTRVIDVAGNTGAVSSQTAIIDTTAPDKPGVALALDQVGPVTGPISNGDVTDDSRPVFSGRGEVGATVRIYDNNAIIGTTTVDKSGSWSFTPAMPLDNATHTITTTQTDLAGNVSAISDPLTFHVGGSGGPTMMAIIKAIDDYGPYTGDIANGGATDDVTPTLVGKAAPNALLTITEGGTTLGKVTVDANGNWSLTLPTQAEGTHTYTATAQNAAGTTAMATFTLTIDITPPQEPVIDKVEDDVGPIQGYLSNGDRTDDQTPTLYGSGAKPGDTIRIFDNGIFLDSVTVKPDGTWNYTPWARLDEGPHALQVSACDPLGNESAKSAAFNIVVDTTHVDPFPSITSYTDDVQPLTGEFGSGTTTDDTLPKLNGMAWGLQNGDMLAIYQDGVLVGYAAVNPTEGTWSYQITNELTEGSHTYKVAVIDLVGNRGPLSNPFTLTVDTTHSTLAPRIVSYTDDVQPLTGEFGSGTATNDTLPKLNGTVSGLQNGDTLAIYQDGVYLGNAVVNPAEGTWSYQITNELTEGTHTYKAVLIDPAGNQGPASNPFTLTVEMIHSFARVEISAINDDVGPVTGVVPNGGSTDDTTPQIVGTISRVLDAGEQVLVLRDGVMIGAAEVTGTTWVYNDSVADGQIYVYSARVQDAAGNHGAESTPYAISLDHTGGPGLMIAITAIQDDTGVSASDFITIDQTLVFSGTLSRPLPSGEKVQVSLDDGKTWHDAVTTGTAWIWDNTATTLPLGTYTIQARVVDAAGNTGAATSQMMVIDTHGDPGPVVITGFEDNVAPLTGEFPSGSVTDDTSPLLKGMTPSLGDHEMVMIYGDGQLLGSASVAGNTWIYQLSNLSQGVHSYTAAIMDAAGNRGPVSDPFSITIDPAPPVTTILKAIDDVGPITGDIPNGGTTDDMQPTLVGTAAPGAVVTIMGLTPPPAPDSPPGLPVVLGTTTADAHGNWSFEVGKQSEGEHTYTAMATDAAGNQSSASFSLTIDITPPAATVTITGVDPGSGVVNNFNIESSELISGLTVIAKLSETGLQSGEKLMYSRDDGANWIDITSAVNGTDISYADPQWAWGSVKMKVVDAAGNAGPEANQPISVYVIDPRLIPAITGIDADSGVAGDFITNDKDGLTVHAVLALAEAPPGTLRELSPGDKLIYSTDRVNWIDITDSVNGYNIEYFDSSLTSTKTVYMRIEYAGGGRGPQVHKLITIDPTAPAQTLTIADSLHPTGAIGPDGKGGVSYALTGTISAALADGHTPGESAESVQVSLDGGTTWHDTTIIDSSWVYSFTSLPSSGNFTAQARVVDVAGNAGPVATHQFGNDDLSITTLPSIVGIFQEPDGTLYVKGTAQPGNTVTITYPDGSTVTGVADADGHYAFTSKNVQTSGAVSVIATDPNGHSSAPVTETWTDTTAPQVPMLNPLIDSDGDILVIGTAEPNSTVTATFSDGSKYTSGTDDISGAFSLRIPGGAHAATGTITVTATDAAGNTSAPTTAHWDSNSSISIPSNSITIDSMSPDTGANSNDFITSATLSGGEGSLTFTGTLGQPLIQSSVFTEFVRVWIFDAAGTGMTEAVATVNGTTWTCTPPSTLPDGTYTVAADILVSPTQTPELAYSWHGQAMQTLVVDTTAPAETVTINDSFNVIALGIPPAPPPQALFAGTLSAPLADGGKGGGSAETLQVSLDGGQTWHDANTSGTDWKYLSDFSDLPNTGSFSLLARVIDAAGNTGTVATQQFTNGNAPAITIDSISPDTGASPTDFITNVMPVFHGKLGKPLADGQTVQVSLDDGKNWGDATVDGTEWHYGVLTIAIYPPPSQEGTYAVQARIIDNTGATVSSTATPTMVVVDTTPPDEVVTITATAPAVISPTPSEPGQPMPMIAGIGATAIGTISTPLADGSQPGTTIESVQVSLDGGKTWGMATVNGTTWSYTSPWGYGLPVDSTEVQARVVDFAGNAGPIATHPIAIDGRQLITVDGIASDTGASASDFITNDSTLVFKGSLSGTLPSGLGVQINLNGTWNNASVNGTEWTYDGTANPLADGSYPVSTRVVDSTGAQVGNTYTRTAMVDTTPPTETLTINNSLHATGAIGPDGKGGVSYALTGTISAALADGHTPGESAESVQVSLDGGTTWHDTTIIDSSWVYSFTSLPSSGNFTAQARVVDAAGNAGPVATHQFGNNSAPAAPTAAVTPDGHTAYGMAEPGSAITVTYPDGSTATGTAGANGVFSITSDITLNPRDAVSITATNAAGASEPESVLVPYAMGLIPPPNPDGTTTLAQGTAEPGSTVTMVFPDGGTITATADPDGNYSLISKTPYGGPWLIIEAEQHPIPTATATISSIADDTGASATDFITSDATLVINATVTGTLKAGDKVQISLDNGATWHDTTPTGNSYQYDATATPLDAGSYTFQARVIDAAGNTGPVTRKPVMIDSVGDDFGWVRITAITDDTGTPGDFITSDPTLVFSGSSPTLASGDKVQISLDNGVTWHDTTPGADKTWSYDNTATPLADGTHTLQARVIDAAGNSGSTDVKEFVIDTAVHTSTATLANDTDVGTPTLASFVIQGASAGDYTGAVSSAGDINGDGYGDLIIGAPGSWTLNTGVGKAYVIYGKGPGGVYGELHAATGQQVLDLSSLAPADGFIIQGDASSDSANTGWSVSSAGDINGDGFDDFIVGAPGSDNGGTYAGEAYVVFGKGPGGIYGEFDATTGRQVLDLSNLTPADGFIIQGDAAYDAAGSSVSSAGDINGDGYGDFIVGAPGGDDGGAEAGEAYVVFGKGPGGVYGELDATTGRQVLDLTSLKPTDGFIIQGDTESAFAGYPVSSAGDINGDGYADLIVGAANDNDYGTWNGKAYALFGKGPGGVYGDFDATTGRQVLDLSSLAPDDGFVLQGDKWIFDRWNYEVGTPVSGAGDINGDGYDDLIAAMSYGVDGGADAGAAYVVYGKGPGGVYGALDAVTGRQTLDLSSLAPADGFIIQSNLRGEWSSYSVSGAGDINGDGYDDLILGAVWNDDGGIDAHAYVVYGKGPGGVYGALDAATGRQVLDLAHLAPTDGFIIQGDPGDDATDIDDVLGIKAGYSVSSAGDLNGDGYGDLIVGVPNSDDRGVDAGKAYVIFGHAGPFGSVDATGREVLDLSALLPHAADVAAGSSGAAPASTTGASQSAGNDGTDHLASTSNTEVLDSITNAHTAGNSADIATLLLQQNIAVG